MKVTVLIENKKCKGDRLLKNEHGLSLHLDIGGRKILMDTGASGTFMDNAVHMGIDTEEVQAVVLSHAHMDHSGGLIRFLEQNKTAVVYVSKHVIQDYYARVLLFKLNVSMDKRIFDQYAHRIRFVDDTVEISEGVFLIPPPALHAYPLSRNARSLLMRKEGKLVQDNFEHELILAVVQDGKLNVFTGCGHNGISNMLEKAMACFPGMPVHTVTGGFHLMGIPAGTPGETREYIHGLAQRIKGMNVEKIYTMHCTGEKDFELLKQDLGDSIVYISTGTQLEF